MSAWEDRERYMRRQEAEHDLIRMRDPNHGYMACCGRSFFRGHSDCCPKHPNNKPENGQ